METPDASKYGKMPPKVEDSPEVVNAQILEIIQDLKEPCGRLLEQLREHVEAGDYNLIIGDDASGRIPTLTLYGVIRERYRELGHSLPEVRFIAGSRHLNTLASEKQHKIGLYLQELGLPSEKIKRALIITDTIDTGISLEPLADELRDFMVPFDIATVALTESTTQEKLEKRFGVRIYTGGVEVARVYRKPELNGVRKSPFDLFSVPDKASAAPDERSGIQGKVNKAREFSAMLSHDLLLKYKEKL